MASLMAPSVAPSAGITQRLNSFESNISAVKEASRDYRNSLGQFNQLAKSVIQVQLAAHNAANEAKLTDYSLRLQKAHNDILNDLKTKTNKDAVDARAGVMKSFADIEKQLSDELANEDPSVVEGFKKQAQKTLFNSQTNADAYVMEQSVKYRDTQRAAQIENLAQDMALNMENPVMYSKALEEFRSARAQQDDELGIEAGSDASKAMDRKVTDSIYGSEITKLIGLKKFGAADNTLQNAVKNEFINANTYNRALVDLFISREAAARQAEMDAQRRARFKAAQAKDAWDIKNAMLKNEMLKDEKIRQELKKQYGKLPDYEINAIQHQMQNKLEASDVYKKREITELDPETGAEITKTVDIDPETRKRLIALDAAKFTQKFVTDRDAMMSAEEEALNIVSDAAREGNGDSVISRAMDTLASMPDSAEKEALYKSIEHIRKNVPEGELEARVVYGMDVTKPSSTALAKDALDYLQPNQIPTDANGNVDSIALRGILKQKGISNYSATDIKAIAQKKVKQAKDARENTFTSKDFVTSRNTALVSIGDALLNEGILDDERLSFDPRDASSKKAEDQEKYAAGRYVLRRVMDDIEQRVANIQDPNERQRAVQLIIRSSETKELIKRYADDDAFDRNLMSNDEMNQYNDARIERWRNGK